MIGLPCLAVTREQMASLMAAADADPGAEFVVDVAQSEVRVGRSARPCLDPALVAGSPDHGQLGRDGPVARRLRRVERAAARLPYLNGFSA